MPSPTNASNTVSTNASSKKKSCCWLGHWHCCWLNIVFGLIVIVAVSGLYWKHMQMEREVSNLSEQIKKGTPGQLQTQLDTVNLLVNMANVNLKTFGEKKSALSYLAQAKQQVQMLPESAEQRALQQALGDDMQKIAAVEIMSLDSVSKKLDALIEQSRNIEVTHIAADQAKPAAAAGAPAATPATATASATTTAPKTTVAAAPAQEKDWQEKLHEGWQHLKDLVKSEDKGASDNLVETWLVPAKLGMQLEEIKLAAFYRDSDFFQKLIGQTLDWMGNHFDLAKNEKASAIKNDLEAMKSWTLTPNAAVLSASMSALDNLKIKPATS